MTYEFMQNKYTIICNVLALRLGRFRSNDRVCIRNSLYTLICRIIIIYRYKSSKCLLKFKESYIY